jgi:NAD-dependent dihydropyrimidine dehydrogenase PreA subunit
VVSLEIRNELCVACKLCVYICPEMKLFMAGGFVAALGTHEKCSLCGTCEKECPEKAITIRKD